MCSFFGIGSPNRVPREKALKDVDASMRAIAELCSGLNVTMRRSFLHPLKD